MKQLKVLLTCLTIVLFGLWSPLSSDATEINVPDGFAIGDDRGISVTEDGGYFFNLDGLMPGDTITRNLIIQNNRTEDYQLKMMITPQSHEGPVNLIESIKMKFTFNGIVIYNGNLSSDENGNTVESREIDFGLIPAGSSQTMAIELKVLRNIPFDEFMAGPSEAVVTWTFIAEHEAVSSSTDSSIADTTIPLETSSITDPAKPAGKYPSTGELPSKILFTLGGIFLAVTVVLYFMVYRKKDTQEEGNVK